MLWLEILPEENWVEFCRSTLFILQDIPPDCFGKWKICLTGEKVKQPLQLQEIRIFVIVKKEILSEEREVEKTKFHVFDLATDWIAWDRIFPQGRGGEIEFRCQRGYQ